MYVNIIIVTKFSKYEFDSSDSKHLIWKGISNKLA